MPFMPKVQIHCLYWALCQQKVLLCFYNSDENLQYCWHYEFCYKISQNWEQWFYGLFSNVKIKNSVMKLEALPDLIKHGVSLWLDVFF